MHNRRVDLHGKRAIVTGGGRGIGAAVVRALAERGAAVTVAARTRDQVEQVARELGRAGHSALAAAVDVTDPDSVRALVALGAADILVNNAGVAASAPIKAIRLEDWNRIFAVNATGTLLCTQAYIEGMAARGWGRVVNVASITSLAGAPYVAAYTASKHAVLGFTRVAAAEYRARGVTINAVCPGYVDTEMTTASVARIVERTGLSSEQALAGILKTAGQTRLVTVEEVAYVVTSLCADQAGAVNGQAIVVDGGGLLS
jgi:NAD(P)-dependent dehydrogenase (short-subunit alcohol dehydrogenase family)